MAIDITSWPRSAASLVLRLVSEDESLDPHEPATVLSASKIDEGGYGRYDRTLFKAKVRHRSRQ